MQISTARRGQRTRPRGARRRCAIPLPRRAGSCRSWRRLPASRFRGVAPECCEAATVVEYPRHTPVAAAFVGRVNHCARVGTGGAVHAGQLQEDVEAAAAGGGHQVADAQPDSVWVTLEFARRFPDATTQDALSTSAAEEGWRPRRQQTGARAGPAAADRSVDRPLRGEVRELRGQVGDVGEDDLGGDIIKTEPA
jgi:hypothetical protein